ncbi:MAG TPA: DUF3822 family protein [Bacteroidetes bacterium]|nr:DUF3822 family protein [Bacteroidota bacterium]
MQKLELFDETFDPDRTEAYELSIQVSLNGFSFCIKDLSRNFFIGLGSRPFEKTTVTPDDWSHQVSAMVNAYTWLTKPFKRVIFSFESEVFTLIPEAVFAPEKAKILLAMAAPLNDLDEVRFNKMPNSIYSVFSIPSLLVTSWLRVQPKSKIVAYCDSALHYHSLNANIHNENSITISFADGFAIAIASKEKQLKQCTSVKVENAEDIAYHAMNISKTLGNSPSTTSIQLVGHFKMHDELQTILNRYFAKVITLSTAEQSHFSYLISKHKKRFANLFNQSLCA